MWPLFLFAALPVAEIAGFIVVGGWIGVLPTLALVLLSGLAGTLLLRLQGARTALGLRDAMSGLRHPTAVLADGAVVLFAAVLLIVPGFLTDLVALALLLPPVRSAVIAAAARRTRFADRPGHGQDGANGGRVVIDGEFVDITDPDPGMTPRTSRRPSGWTIE